MSTIREDLVEDLRSGRVVLVVGAGVSRAVAGIPTWNGLIDNAIDYLHRSGLASEDQIVALRASISSAGTSEELIQSADAVRDCFDGEAEGSGAFADWLDSTFEPTIARIRMDDPLLRAIHRIGAGLIMTTNYDKIVSTSGIALEPATWEASDRLLRALDSRGYVVHLHGVWDDPTSVVFSSRDYQRLEHSEAYHSFMRTLWMARTLVFVGCSLDGIQDPDFSLLLHWAARTFPNSPQRHYALLRRTDCTEDNIARYLNDFRIQLISYGDDYSDLPAFLESLAPPIRSLHPPLPAHLVRRADLDDSIGQSICRGRKVLIHGMGGIGKTTATTQAVLKFVEADPESRAYWLEGDFGSLPELARELCFRLGLLQYLRLADDELMGQLPTILSGLGGLVIFVVDSVTDRAILDAMTRLFTGQNSILIVTSRLVSSSFDERIRVSGLTRNEAIGLFGHISPESSQDPTIVDEICSILEDHVLSISLAAARHAIDGLHLTRLRDRLASEVTRLNTLVDPEHEEDASTSVRASISSSIEDLDTRLWKALATISAFDTVVSTELAAQCLGLSLQDSEDLIGRLVRRSLLHVVSDRVFMHSVTRSVVRNLAELRGEREEMDRRLEECMADVVFKLETDSRTTRRRIADDIDAVIGFCSAVTADSPFSRQLVAALFGMALCDDDGILEAYGLSLRYFSVVDDFLRTADSYPTLANDSAFRTRLIACRANHLLRGLRLESAQQLLTSELERIEGDSPDPDLLAMLRTHLGNIYLSLNELELAEECFTFARDAARSCGNVIGLASATGQLGRVFLNRNQLDESERLYREARALYEAEGFRTGIAACDYNLSEIALRRSDPNLAWESQMASVDDELAADNWTGVMGSLEWAAGHVQSNEQLGRLFERIAEIEPLIPAATVRALPGLSDSLRSTAYISIGRLDEAEALVRAGLQERELAGDPRRIAVARGRLSSIYQMNGDYLTARTLNEQSRSAYAQVFDRRGELTCLLNGVSIAMSLGEENEAIDLGCQAICLACDLGDVVAAGEALKRMIPVLGPLVPDEQVVSVPAPGSSNRELLSRASDAARQRDWSLMLGSLIAAQMAYMERSGRA